MRLLKISLWLFLLCGILPAFAIELPQQAPEKHPFSEAQWEKTKKGIDYSREAPPAEKKPVKGFSFDFDPGIGKAVIYIAVFVLLVFILLKVLKGNMLLGDKKINVKNTFTNVAPEDDIHHSNLEELYTQATAEGNFRLAVRYRYLIIIRELSNKQFIKWKKEKTNADYIFDMVNNAFQKPFREVTFLFEKIWYGKTELSEQNFMLVSTRFNEFMAEVKSNPSVNGETLKSPT